MCPEYLFCQLHANLAPQIPEEPKGETMQQQYETLAHGKFECKYHLVFIPKYRKKVLYGHIRKRVGETVRAEARGRDCGSACDA